jgi:hypothetical protein
LLPLFLFAAFVLVSSDDENVYMAVTCFQLVALTGLAFVTVLISRRTWSIEYGLLIGVLYIAVFGRHTMIRGLREANRFIYDYSFASKGWLNPNLHALYCVLYLAFVLRFVTALAHRHIRKAKGTIARILISAIGAAVCCYEVAVRTGSRKGMIILFVLCAGGLVLVTRSYRGVVRLDAKHLLIACLVSCIGIAGVYLLLKDTQHFERLALVGNWLTGRGKLESSIVGRGQLASTAIELWLSRPLLGCGTNAMTKHAGVYAHSNPLELLANYGLLGIVLFYTLHIRLVRLCIAKIALDNGAEWIYAWLLLLLLVLLLFDLFAVIYLEKVPLLTLGAVAGLSLRETYASRHGIATRMATQSHLVAAE